MTKQNIPDLSPIHPGEILFEEFMRPWEISGSRLAKELHVSPMRIHEIIIGKRSITADTALRLARFFKMEAQFWLNLQSRYDLETATLKSAKKINHDIRPFEEAA